jgi:hypothetical protein
MEEKSNSKSLRKFKRIEIEMAVKYQPIKCQNWYVSVTKGLGAGGICLISMEEYIGIGTVINIKLSLSGSIVHIGAIGELYGVIF